MSDHPSVEKWEQFLDGQLALGECRTLEAHLETCAQCQRALERLPVPTGVLPLLSEQAPRWPAPPAPEKVAPPADRYELLSELGRGGMGAVLRGHDRHLGRDLAIKVLLERHRCEPALLQRFVAEAQVAGRLQHPGVAPVYDLGELPDGRAFFSMKLVVGRTLAALLQ